MKRLAKNEKGLTLIGWIELLIAIAIIGVVIYKVAIPQFGAQSARVYDIDAKANLKNLYKACKSYWGAQGSSASCNQDVAAGTAYGFVQSADVNIDASGDENRFSATANHTKSSNTFTLDAAGGVTP